MTNSGETKYQVVMTNPFILNLECSCTHFQTIKFSLNPQQSTRLSM